MLLSVCVTRLSSKQFNLITFVSASPEQNNTNKTRKHTGAGKIVHNNLIFSCRTIIGRITCSVKHIASCVPHFSSACAINKYTTINHTLSVRISNWKSPLRQATIAVDVTVSLLKWTCKVLHSKRPYFPTASEQINLSSSNSDVSLIQYLPTG